MYIRICLCETDMVFPNGDTYNWDALSQRIYDYCVNYCERNGHGAPTVEVNLLRQGSLAKCNEIGSDLLDSFMGRYGSDDDLFE